MAAKKQIVVHLDRENETKNKFRFKESDDEQVLAHLYIKKLADKKLGAPKAIKVTIEPA